MRLLPPPSLSSSSSSKQRSLLATARNSPLLILSSHPSTGSPFPIGDVFPALSNLILRLDRENTPDLAVSFLLPLVREALQEGIRNGAKAATRKIVTFELFTFLNLLGQLKRHQIPADLWKLVQLLFRFLHRSPELNAERAFLLYQNFISLSETRISTGESSFSKLFVAMRLNVFLRGLACTDKRCLACFARPREGMFCEGCAEARYCSGECKKRDEKAHGRECGKKSLKDQLAAEMTRELPAEYASPTISEIIAALDELKRYDDPTWRPYQR